MPCEMAQENSGLHSSGFIALPQTTATATVAATTAAVATATISACWQPAAAAARACYM